MEAGCFTCESARFRQTDLRASSALVPESSQSPNLRGLKRNPVLKLIVRRGKGDVVGVAFRPKMTEGDDRDPEDRELPAERDHEIDAVFVALALVLGGIIAFELIFG